jgi:hypothetical protein
VSFVDVVGPASVVVMSPMRSMMNRARSSRYRVDNGIRDQDGDAFSLQARFGSSVQVGEGLAGGF